MYCLKSLRFHLFLAFLIIYPPQAYAQLDENRLNEVLQRASIFLYHTMKGPTAMCPNDVKDIYAVKGRKDHCASGDTNKFAGVACAAGLTHACDSVLASQDSNGGFWRSSALINQNNHPENVSDGTNVPAGTKKPFSRDMAIGVLLALANHPDKQFARSKFQAWINRINYLSDKTQIIDLDGDTPEYIEQMVNHQIENYVEFWVAAQLEQYNILKCIALSPELLKQNWMVFWNNILRINSPEKAAYFVAKSFQHFVTQSEQYLESAFGYTASQINDLKDLAQTGVNDARNALNSLGEEGQRFINKIQGVRIGGSVGEASEYVKSVFNSIFLYNPQGCSLPGIATFSTASLMESLDTWICPHNPPDDILTSANGRISWQGFCSIGEIGHLFHSVGANLGVSVPETYKAGAGTYQEEIDLSKLMIYEGEHGFLNHLQYGKAILYESVGVKSRFTREILELLEGNSDGNPLYYLRSVNDSILDSINAVCPTSLDWKSHENFDQYRWEREKIDRDASTTNNDVAYWDCLYLYVRILDQYGKKETVRKLSASRFELKSQIEKRFGDNPKPEEIESFMFGSLQLAGDSEFEVCTNTPISVGDILVPVKHCSPPK